MSDTVFIGLIVVARAFHYGIALAMFGFCFFVGLLIPGRSRPPSPFAASLHLTAAAGFAVSALLWLAAESAIAGDGPSDFLSPAQWWNVLAATDFGHAFALQLLLSLVLLVVGSRAGVQLLASAWGLSLATLGGLGHAVMTSTLGAIVLPLIQAVHLLVGGYWIGGLLAIALSPIPKGKDWTQALMRFSYLGHGAVALTLITGSFLVFEFLGPVSALWNRNYLIPLLAKIIIVSAMAGLAIYNRYWLVPQMKASPGASLRLEKIVKLNLALSVAVLVLVSFFGELSPTLDM